MAALEDSAFGRLIGVLVAPGKTFRSLAERPTWGAALVLLLAVSTCVGVIANQHIDKGQMRQMMKEKVEKARGGQVSPEEIDRMVAFTEKVSSVTRWLIPVFTGVFYLVVAALFLGAFRFFSGSDLSFRKSFAVALHGFLPSVVAALLAIPVILSRGTLDVRDAQSGNFLASNLGVFAPDGMGAVPRALLTSVDFFSLWTTLLLVVGYRVAAKVSTGAATAVVAVLWGLGIAVKLGLAAFSS